MVADDRTAVVHVEQLLHGPDQLSVPSGGKTVLNCGQLSEQRRTSEILKRPRRSERSPK